MVARVAFAAGLEQCSRLRPLSKGMQLHQDMVKIGAHADRFLGNRLVIMYSSCGALIQALQAFDSIVQRDALCWEILLTEFGRNGHLEEAERVFNRMPSHSAGAFSNLIAAHARLGNLQQAKFLFDSLPDSCAICCTAIIVACARSGNLKDAKIAFDSMRGRDVIPWSALVAAYAQNGHLTEAANIFQKMPSWNVVVWTTMIWACTRSGDIVQASQIFTTMQQRNIVSWNSMITAFAQSGQVQKSRLLFQKMPARDSISWTAVLVACAQSGDVQEAKEIFEQMPQKCTISWSAMLGAYAQNGHAWEALFLFKKMDLEGLSPSTITYTSAVDSCTTLGAAPLGRLIHGEIVSGKIEVDALLGTALINMYGKFGCLRGAQQIFESIPRIVGSWSAMITAYAENGRAREAVGLLSLMQLDGIQPDHVTMLSILSACSHAGLAIEGLIHFSLMRTECGVRPLAKHYECVMDLLSRSGILQQEAHDQNVELDENLSFMDQAAFEKELADVQQQQWII